MAAVECMIKDDTQCAVDIWEDELARHPQSDEPREALHFSLMAHTIRSLDQGNLQEARTSFERAQELAMSHPLHSYLREALSIYDERIYVALMKGSEFEQLDNEEWQTHFAQTPGVMGGETTVFEMTYKRAGYQNYYYINMPPITTDFAMRYLLLPLGSNGSVITLFGQHGPDDYHVADIKWRSPVSTSWTIRHADPTAVYPVNFVGGDSVIIEPNVWHMMEIRLRGRVFELWVDTIRVGTQLVSQYEPGGIGIGLGLNETESGGSFSAAFDDLCVYSLVGNSTPTPTFAPSSESPLYVGRTEVTWTGNWQHDPSFLSVPGVTLSQIDMNAEVVKVAYIGDTAGNDTVETKADVFNFYIRQFTETGSTVVKTGVGAIENGGMWMTFIFFYQGVHVTLLITVSGPRDLRFEVDALMANTDEFEAAVELARREIMLDGQPRFLEGVSLSQ